MLSLSSITEISSLELVLPRRQGEYRPLPRWQMKLTLGWTDMIDRLRVDMDRERGLIQFTIGTGHFQYDVVLMGRMTGRARNVKTKVSYSLRRQLEDNPEPDEGMAEGAPQGASAEARAHRRDYGPAETKRVSVSSDEDTPGPEIEDELMSAAPQNIQVQGAAAVIALGGVDLGLPIFCMLVHHIETAPGICSSWSGRKHWRAHGCFRAAAVAAPTTRRMQR